MSDSIIKDKSFSFALRIIKLYKYLCESKREYVISKQILRSGTSIGANTREALSGESKKDFIHKLGIALKEANETDYWLQLLVKSDFIEEHQHTSINKDCIEIIKILNSIILTSKNETYKKS